LLYYRTQQTHSLANPTEVFRLKSFIKKIFSDSKESEASSAKSRNSIETNGEKPEKHAKPNKTQAGKQQKSSGSKNEKHQNNNQNKSNQDKQNQKSKGLTANTPESLTPENDIDTEFQKFDLHPALLKAIKGVGYSHCTPIQAETLPYTLNRQDMIGKAQTGTGKTAAFLITIIDFLLKNPLEERYAGEPRALIIAPTRELAIQIGEDALGLCKGSDLTVLHVVGGMDLDKQIKTLDNKTVDILVATPGRLMDLQQRKSIFLDMVDILVLDEADRMLDMGFIPQVSRIVRATPSTQFRQTLLFSATFTPEIMELSQRWTHDPVSIEIEPESVATDTVEQIVYIVTTEEKYTLLYNLLKKVELSRTIIFANRRDETRKLAEILKKQNINCAILSGEVPQHKRIKTLEDFRSGKIPVLVATDVAGRGLHVNDISHVINFSLPEDPEDYVHRIGRTGRAGTSGTSISFACEDDSFRIPNIEELLGNKLKCEIPDQDLLSGNI